MRLILAGMLALVATPVLAQSAPPTVVTPPGEGMMDKPCPADQRGLNFAHPYVRQYDWAWQCRFAEADKQLAQRPRVVFIGDSITENWVGLAPSLFVSGGVGRGISGQTSPQVLVRFYQDVVRLRPRVVHIMVGTNDLAGNTGPNSPEMYTNHVTAMVDLAQANGIAVVIGSVLPAAKFPWKPQLAPAKPVVALNTWLKAFAKARGAAFADYHAALVNAEGGINPDLAPDGIHPNAKGYAVMEPIARAAIAEAEKLGGRKQVVGKR
ncbi:MAG: GDSL family lipase [Novosphingobium sp. 16-62-11]|uniref:GDSL-type esterase/lipase family protein n=1 Tax=Novosphingobium sp. 17-62-19 TaxID=1970406 RepID=UPI000BDD9C58|nr:GDSL-type esterase/lipase family protein [Novosphingobium sp. 17-62-19]OYX96148.1 MAG: GDSL family lipase [Novosphingobium sp. 35-62-5]OYZ35584.1 MAG: GDSL family lipase [Novosphingobium sp. 16-62-11]OZA17861.1 MAG: GDSL family lipase [Novosphingobium sp. 17-62-19]HQS97714.1 GDSL-type esterase/lipase family protein [Novosphingobium sp.]